jgi:hypothetical protein
MAKRPKKPSRPEIDREAFEVLHPLAGETTADLARRSFLSYSTIRNMRKNPKDGGTKFPRRMTIAELGRLSGRKLVLLDEAEAEHIQRKRATVRAIAANAGGRIPRRARASV